MKKSVTTFPVMFLLSIVIIFTPLTIKLLKATETSATPIAKEIKEQTKITLEAPGSAKWVSDTVDNYQDKIIQISDKIWDYAELSWKEKKSSAAYKEALTEAGFKIQSPVAGIDTAFVASYGKGKPVIALLAEYDALDGLSQKALSLKKEPIVEGGSGHGCGHNLLGAGTYGAALAIKDYLEKTGKSGTVVLFGCPAEESGSAKTFMARAGLFKNIDIAFSWHPGDWTGVMPTSTLALNQMNYKFTGTPSHAAAAPEAGRSASDAVELMNVGANYLREHIPSSVRMHDAVLDAGGVSPNVVPGHAELVYLIRAPQLETVQDVQKRLDDVARGAALMTGTTVEIRKVNAVSALMVNKVIADEVVKAMNEIGFPKFSTLEQSLAKKYIQTLDKKGKSSATTALLSQIITDKEKLKEILNSPINTYIMPYSPLHMAAPGSSDVSDVSLNCPTVMFFVSTAVQGTPEHSWQMVAQGKAPYAYKGMLFASKVITLTAINFLNDPELVKEAQDEFKESTDGKKYKSPLGNDVPLPLPKDESSKKKNK